MANSNGWGDGSANNTIGWGQGAVNNSNNWGDSHAKSWAGLTDIVGATTDADAQAFITAAAITDPTQQTAINTLVKGLKTDGLWSKMKAVYPFVGGTASAHKYNLLNPVDSDAAFRLVFNGGWTHSSTGATPNGTNGYADTKLVPSSALTQDSTHLTYYSRTNNSFLEVEMGATITGSTRFSFEISYNGSLSSDQYNYLTGRVNVANSNSTGFYVASRTNASTHKVFKNNSQIGATNTGSSGTLSLINKSIYIGAVNDSAYSSKQTAFASIGDGLTDTDAANLYNRVQAFQIALNRQV